jgi:hypothetical protein
VAGSERIAFVRNLCLSVGSDFRVVSPRPVVLIVATIIESQPEQFILRQRSKTVDVMAGKLLLQVRRKLLQMRQLLLESRDGSIGLVSFFDELAMVKTPEDGRQEDNRY